MTPQAPGDGGTAARASAPGRRVQQVHLVEEPDGDARGTPTRVTLDGLVLEIGRLPQGERTLPIADPRLSRRHLQIERDAVSGDATAVDCGSRHGTFVDGARISRAALHHGSVIRVGESVLVYTDVELGADEASALVPETPSLPGRSVAMQRLRGRVARLASGTQPVLVVGERGTGKTRVAAEIHRVGKRPGAFVVIDCAASPADEAKIFAPRRNEGGAFVVASGTLVLAHADALSPELQAKVADALATMQGSELRIVATARLEANEVTHRLRAELAAPLSRATIAVPPLRDRREDILGLARAVVDARDVRLEWTAGFAEALVLHTWPANVRELEEVVAGAGGAPVLGVELLPGAIARPVLSRPTLTPGGESELPAPPHKAGNGAV